MDRANLTDVTHAVLNMEGKSKPTLLGIGPMSKNLIRASFLLAKEKDFPLMFIASRNQVDAQKLGGGYVCNWDQEGFSKAIDTIAEEVEFEGLYFKCRDHGGPWQRDNERKARLPEKEAMALGKESYLEDLIHGFDLLHIDPTKDPETIGKIVPLEDVLRRTIELIEFVEDERRKRNLPVVGYEVGTEETNGGLTSKETYETFIETLISRLKEKNLPIPLFIVGQTGTLTRLTENTGEFSGRNAKTLAEIAQKYDVGLKEHNGDYLDDHILLQHPALGITGMNVAPEFGTVETRGYLELIKVEKDLYKNGIIKKQSKLEKVLIEEAVKSQRWRKWMTGKEGEISITEIMKDEGRARKITEICGHYTFNNMVVEEEILQLYANLSSAGIDGQEYVINKLQEAINRYVLCFNLQGLTTRVLKKENLLAWADA